MVYIRRIYSREFKLQAVQQYASGVENMTLIENELNIRAGLLSKWRIQYLPELLATSAGLGRSSIQLIGREGDANFKPQRVILATSVAIPIWTRAPIDNLDWVQFYGHTKFATKAIYSSSNGVHTGIDWGKFRQLFAAGQQHPVFAACEGEVIKADSNPERYKPGRIDLRPKTYPGLILIYGHLQNIQVNVGNTVGPQTLLGFLDPGERHVHIEIRRKDNSYINPYPYLTPVLKKLLFRFAGKDSGTIYDKHHPDPIPASGSYS